MKRVNKVEVTKWLALHLFYGQEGKPTGRACTRPVVRAKRCVQVHSGRLERHFSLAVMAALSSIKISLLLVVCIVDTHISVAMFCILQVFISRQTTRK